MLDYKFLISKRFEHHDLCVKLKTGLLELRFLKKDTPDQGICSIFDEKKVFIILGARRVILVGNGGIATEVAYEIEGCQVIWVVKHENISVPFLDTAASQFLLRSRADKRQQAGDSKTGPLIQTLRYTLADRNKDGEGRLVLVGAKKEDPELKGSALGPDWTQGKRFTGIIDEKTLNRPLKVNTFYFNTISRFCVTLYLIFRLCISVRWMAFSHQPNSQTAVKVKLSPTPMVTSFLHPA